MVNYVLVLFNGAFLYFKQNLIVFFVLEKILNMMAEYDGMMVRIMCSTRVKFGKWLMLRP